MANKLFPKAIHLQDYHDVYDAVDLFKQWNFSLQFKHVGMAEVHGINQYVFVLMTHDPTHEDVDAALDAARFSLTEDYTNG